VIFEPVMFTGRAIPPAPGFLGELQALARRRGVLTILDDCLMFRLAPGGSSKKYGITPDLVVLGKFIGGGTPLGAVVGPREIMAVLDPNRAGAMFHGGSFNGNVLGCAAGLVAVRDLTATAIAAMDQRTARLIGALRAKAESVGIAISVTGEGSVGGIAFAADPLRHEDNPAALGLSALFHLACLNEGVALGPGGLFALATMVDDAALAHAIRGMGAALEAVALLPR
jgi:glutamate-1-semialdehyde 2,1-aminomutase